MSWIWNEKHYRENPLNNNPKLNSRIHVLELTLQIYDIHLQANVGQCTWDIGIEHLHKLMNF